MSTTDRITGGSIISRWREAWQHDQRHNVVILLTDAASRWERLGEVTSAVRAALLEAINPYETWGLIPYFNFRSESEQAMRHEPEWA